MLKSRAVRSPIARVDDRQSESLNTLAQLLRRGLELAVGGAWSYRTEITSAIEHAFWARIVNRPAMNNHLPHRNQPPMIAADNTFQENHALPADVKPCPRGLPGSNPCDAFDRSYACARTPPQILRDHRLKTDS